MKPAMRAEVAAPKVLDRAAFQSKLDALLVRE
jgi:hypothetical protein